MKSAMADKQYRSYIYTEIRVSIKLRSTHPYLRFDSSGTENRDFRGKNLFHGFHGSTVDFTGLPQNQPISRTRDTVKKEGPCFDSPLFFNLSMQFLAPGGLGAECVQVSVMVNLGPPGSSVGAGSEAPKA